MKYLSVLSILSLLITFLSCKTSNSPDLDFMSRAERPFKTNIEHKTYASGTILPAKEVEIKPQVSGIVEEIYVNTGQKVKTGDPLLKIKIVADPASINSAESSVKTAKINLTQLQKTLDRQRELFEDKIISVQELETAQRNYDIARQEKEAAENNLQLIKEGVSRTNQKANVITATLDGTILSISAKKGGSVMGRNNFSEGTTTMVIADMNRLVFQGTISESEVEYLKLGMNLQLNIGAIRSETFDAKLGFIAPKGIQEEGGVKFEFSAYVVPKDSFEIRAGYSANAEILIDQKDSVWAVKEKDVIYEMGKSYVEVKSGEKEYEKREIKTGISDGINIEVVQGLKPEEEIKSKITRASFETQK